MAFPSQQLPRVTIRVEEPLRQKLMEAAYKADRSLNAEIVARLEASFSDQSGESTEVAELRGEFEELRQSFQLILGTILQDEKGDYSEALKYALYGTGKWASRGVPGAGPIKPELLDSPKLKKDKGA